MSSVGFGMSKSLTSRSKARAGNFPEGFPAAYFPRGFDKFGSGCVFDAVARDSAEVRDRLEPCFRGLRGIGTLDVSKVGSFPVDSPSLIGLPQASHVVCPALRS